MQVKRHLRTMNHQGYLLSIREEGGLASRSISAMGSHKRLQHGAPAKMEVSVSRQKRKRSSGGGEEVEEGARLPAPCALMALYFQVLGKKNWSRRTQYRAAICGRGNAAHLPFIGLE